MSADHGDIHRLGKRYLGRHAFEERMPVKIAQLVNQGNHQNIFEAVIPKLAHLLEHNGKNLHIAYLCTPSVIQVTKHKHEGGHFCGYRNIQMLLSSLPPLLESTTRQLPPWSDEKRGLSVLELQDMIERAWDMGFNSHGRIVTGGIRGTRKHIGTSEAEALLLSLEIPCTGHAFTGKTAWLQLLDFAEQHFSSSSLQADQQRKLPASSSSSSSSSSSTSSSTSSVIVQTNASPIFLQRPGHSITIVGIERDRTDNNNRRLLCFDPAWQPPSTIQRQPTTLLHLPPEKSSLSRYWTLKMYRKSARYLKRYDAFETLVVDMTRLSHK